MSYRSEDIWPFFQPIISADTFDVYGYEVLGRFIHNNTVTSLGPFLQDVSISNEEHLHVDRTIRKKALSLYARTNFNSKLFINIKPKWIYEFLNNPEQIPTIQWLKEYNIPTEKIVIEITEESFNGELSELADILDYYRKIGCKIAIDDFGSNFSNFERIAFVNPDIVKVDMNIVQKSVQIECYDELLKMICSFCQKIGADVLFEGIENTTQLYNCVKSGGRYFQGFLFSGAAPSFEYDKSIGNILQNTITKYKDTELHLSSKRNTISVNLNRILSKYIINSPLPDNAGEFDDYLVSISEVLPSNCIKLFICNENGWQLSSNIEQTNTGTYQKVQRYKNINWSWRSYFLQTLVKMNSVAEGVITKPYRDIVTKEKILTYSFPLDSSHLLLIDILCEDDASL